MSDQIFTSFKINESNTFYGVSQINKLEPEKAPVTKRQRVGGICNDDGCLAVAKIGDQYGWLIENHNNSWNDPDEYELIPEYLYEALVRFENERKR